VLDDSSRGAGAAVDRSTARAAGPMVKRTVEQAGLDAVPDAGAPTLETKRLSADTLATIHGMGALGDIMGSSQPDVADVTFEKFTPLQRVLITANGNLQRLVSSYYNQPVTVTVVRNNCIAKGKFDREVKILIFGVEFCRAISTVTLDSDVHIDAVEKGGIAIGQLFRHFHLLPRFELLDVRRISEDEAPSWAPSATACFARDYILRAKGILCEITEIIRNDVFEIPEADLPSHGVDEPARDSMGDLMAPNKTFMALPPTFTRSQRLLLTANGNLERILSSFYATPIQTYVVFNHKRTSDVYDRQSCLLLGGKQLVLAKTTCFITKREWADAIEMRQIPIGALFAHFGELPFFTLHASGEGPSFFWRQYQLSSSGMTCLVNETFNKEVLGGSVEEDETPSPARSDPSAPDITDYNL